MRLATICFTISLIIGLTGFVFAEPVILGQYPAPSPDGAQLAFSFRGDIWLAPISGGNARRLSVHEAYESLPNWSPDGKMLAFASDRNGNRDVFVMSNQGENLKQLTFLSQDDDVFDWSPDGNSILFSSRRDFSYPAVRLASLYKIDLAGGNPEMVMPDFGDQGKISPDGRYILFTRGRLDLFRKHYRGSMNTDIWRYDSKTGKYLQLTDFDGYDFLPMWAPDGRLVYFVSHTDGTANLWQMNPDGSAKKQLTHHKDDGIYFANIARNARVIAYTRGAEIWVWHEGKESVPLTINVPSDEKNNLVEWETFTSKASEMAISPDEKYVALVVRGEIFLVKNKTKGTSRTVRLTNTPFREENICWTPKGDTLLFVSDRNGNDDIFMLTSDDPAEKNLYRTLKYKTAALTNDKKEEIQPKVSPDGKTIAFLREDDLCTMTRDGKQVKVLLESWNTPAFNWSPDSRWLAYSVEDNEYNSDIFIIPAAGGTPVNITQHPDNDVEPVWSPDGKKLGFSSKRSNDTFDIWYVFLQKADNEKTAEDWEEAEEVEAEAKKAKKEKDKSEKKAEEKIVKIDFKDIHKRLRRLTSLPGDESTLDISPDGKTFIFKTNSDGKNNIWSIEWDGKELKQLTSGNENPLMMHWSQDGKSIFYLKSSGTLHSMGASGSDNKGISFKAQMDLDHVAERRQMFQEAWRVLNQYFYDAKFHGADWPKLRKKYGEIVESIATSEDFYTAVRLMLGELNASHLGIYPPSKPGAIQTGMLGLKFDDQPGNGLKITAVMPDGPCTQAASTVQPGEILLAIDGTPVSVKQNIFELLNQKVDEPVILTIKNQTDKREIVVRPINFSQLMALEYKRWVNEKRELVQKLSNGRLSYLHIQGMGWGNLEQFQTELYSEAHGKDGLLIDVRFNGGGWINDYLLTMLNVRPHAYTVPRGGERAYPQSRLPYYYWSKPFSVLCNQYSFSNAEIFSHAVKVLRLAKVVGEPTPGAVISTGATTLLDGTTFRIPGRGWYNLETGLNQENNGAIPDFIVPVQPGDEIKKIDRQLEKAVEVTLEAISAEK